jgi:putative transposase
LSLPKGAGSRMLRDMLCREGVSIGRRHVATLMKRMGIEAIYRRPNTSKPAPGHRIYPYLLGGLKKDRANQAWASLKLKDGTSPIPRWRGASSI